MRPFTLSRIVDVIRLARTFRGVSIEDVEKAMMVSRDRSVELLRQAEEMKLIRRDGNLFYPTILGNIFFEAYNRDDRAKLDEVLSEYPPYFTIKNIISKKSVSIDELKKLTKMTEVAIEMIIRLLQYTCDNIHFVDEKIFLSSKELPELTDFYSVLRNAYLELSKGAQWGCPNFFVRVDKIAIIVCQELRLSMDDFSSMLDRLVKSGFPVDLYFEGMGYEFIPFVDRKISPSSYRKCYLRLRER